MGRRRRPARAERRRGEAWDDDANAAVAAVAGALSSNLELLLYWWTRTMETPQLSHVGSWTSRRNKKTNCMRHAHYNNKAPINK